MATSEELNDELTCTICLETFKDPKCLPCLHTFCEGCIHTYIVSTFEKDYSKGGFLCPICSSCDTQQKSQVAHDWCLDCEEAYCSQCSTFHRSFKVSSKHKIVSIRDIQRNPKDFKYRKTIVCNLHSEKPVEIFCVDHHMPCCTVCAAVYHRKCDGVIPIETAAQGIKEKATTNDLKKKLSEESKAVDNALTHRKKFSSVFESQIESIQTEIEKIRSNIEKHLDDIQANIQLELNVVKKEVNLQINDDQTHLSSLKSTIENWVSIIETSTSQGTEIQCFLEINKILSQKFELDKALSDRLQEMRNVRLTLKRDLYLQQLTSLQTFGSIQKHDFFWRSVNFHSGVIKQLLLIVLDTEKIPHRCISGVLKGNKIILSDKVNKRIVIFDSDGMKINEILLTGLPRDITVVDAENVAVTIFEEKVIMVANIQSLKVHTELKIDCYANGITFQDDEFVVAQNCAISRIDSMSGSTIRQISTYDTWFCCYIRTDVYIYGTGNYVVCLRKGKSVFKYSSNCLSRPAGIDLDSQRNIYICGCVSNNIHQLNKGGKLIRIIPTETLGITSPWIIRFLKDSNKFLLTSENSGKIVLAEID
ncbi:unnamed protein product [Mytilus coruscus]|uniref:TRIM56 n=1 Tax=Mytilus coruscus TaxID=42192 RepID=A0A6J8D3X2_MYTCO|nr:unnamed protein product [Mytilus coruscus]